MLHSDWTAIPVAACAKTVRVWYTTFRQYAKTASRLQEDTYPLIPGTKYGLLLVFYTLLQQCAEEEAEIKNGNVDLSIHVSLLKKFKSAVRGMDYKTLMTGEDSVSVLRPALLATNVHLIAKLAAKIPCKACDNVFLSSEVVFRVFAEKLFMTGDGKQTEPQDKLIALTIQMGSFTPPLPSLPTTSPLPTITSPTITSPTITSPITSSTITSPTITSPTITSPTITSPTITSPTITSPTITSPTITSPTITSSTITSPTITSPTITSLPSPPLPSPPLPSPPLLQH
ncbi:hypothetical protein EMCRGX_G021612 [Ephydatia muelleri]